MRVITCLDRSCQLTPLSAEDMSTYHLVMVDRQIFSGDGDGPMVFLDGWQPGHRADPPVQDLRSDDGQILFFNWEHMVQLESSLELLIAETPGDSSCTDLSLIVFTINTAGTQNSKVSVTSALESHSPEPVRFTVTEKELQAPQLDHCHDSQTHAFLLDEQQKVLNGQSYWTSSRKSSAGSPTGRAAESPQQAVLLNEQQKVLNGQSYWTSSRKSSAGSPTGRAAESPQQAVLLNEQQKVLNGQSYWTSSRKSSAGSPTGRAAERPQQAVLLNEQQKVLNGQSYWTSSRKSSTAVLLDRQQKILNILLDEQQKVLNSSPTGRAAESPQQQSYWTGSRKSSAGSPTGQAAGSPQQAVLLNEQQEVSGLTCEKMKGNFVGDCLCSLMCAGVFLAGCTVLLVIAFPIVQIAVGAVYMYECPVAPVIPVHVMVCGIWALLMMSLFALPKLLGSNTETPRSWVWTVWITTLVLLFFIWFIYGSYQVYVVYPPSYDKNSSSNATHAELDTGLNAMLENHKQIQSLPDLDRQNQTQIKNSNHTAVTLFGKLVGANRKMSRGGLSPPQHHQLVDTEPYCHQTLYMLAFWSTTLVYVFTGNALVIIVCLCCLFKILNMLARYLP
ncbi:uncharacterized protein LOC117511519 [Thalassophryne amazonica]|uniref:uncharacterized protein LOC117511519 n=1 Tax=Thalassophryne amazonica TaxID=390379 RepID=UPI001472104B|nr:uncharacterized protein LOC117511519 [Thalassophryne amazonica]